MIAKLDSPIVDLEQPFLHCKLGRQKYAEILTQIVGSYEQGCVLAINGEWGSGKTTFMNMWKQLLKNKGFSALYFNVWEHDFVSDPLIGLVAELKSQLGSQECDDTVAKLVETAGQIIAGVIPGLLGNLAKRYIGEDAASIIKDGIGSAVDLFTKEVEEYDHQCSSIDKFRTTLIELVASCCNGKPLVFIVDELDRCNPFYAVKVLERIKHLFTIPNVVFVLSIDKRQLCNSIRGYYGSESIDADQYLRRFIDIEYFLPQPDAENFVEYLYEAYGFNAFFNQPERQRSYSANADGEYFKEMSKILFSESGITLRSMERIYSYMRLVMRTFSANSYIHPGVLLILYYIRMRNQESYAALNKKLLTIEELVSLIEQLLPKSLFVQQNVSDYKVRFAANEVGLMLTSYVLHRNGLKAYNLLNENKDALSFTCKVMDAKLLFESIKHYDRQGYGGCVFDLSVLIEHIELLTTLQGN